MASKTSLFHHESTTTAEILMLVPPPLGDTKPKPIFENNTFISKSGRVINVVERSFDASSEIIDLYGNFEAIVLVPSTRRTFSPNDPTLQILGSTFGPKFTEYMILLFIPADTIKTNEYEIKDSWIGFWDRLDDEEWAGSWDRLDEEWVSIEKESSQPNQPVLEKVEANNPNLLPLIKEDWLSTVEKETQGHKQILNFTAELGPTDELKTENPLNLVQFIKEDWWSPEKEESESHKHNLLSEKVTNNPPKLDAFILDEWFRSPSEEKNLEDLLAKDLKEYFKDISRDRWVFDRKGEDGVKRLIEVIEAVVEETVREPLRHITLNEEKPVEAVHEDAQKAVTEDDEDGNKVVTKDETKDDGPSKPLIIAKFGIAGMRASKGISDALF